MFEQKEGENMDQIISSGVTSDGLTLINKESLIITSGGRVNNTSVCSGCGIFVSSGGTANITFIDNATFRVSSGGMASQTMLNGTVESGAVMHVEDGGYADVVIVNAYTSLCVYSGGTATDIVWTPSIGHLSIEEGAEVVLFSQYKGVYYGDGSSLISSTMALDRQSVATDEEMYVFSGGIATRTRVDERGTLHVMSDGTVESTTLYGGTLVLSEGVANNTTNYGGNIMVSSGGIMNSAVSLDNGHIMVYSGGTANNAIASNAVINVSSGGKLNGFTIRDGGALYAGTEAVLTGRIILSDDAYVYLEHNAIVDFNISTLTYGAPVRFNNFQLVEGWMSTDFFITISGNQPNGTYSLAIGFPEIEQSITVVDTEGEILATLSLGETKEIFGEDCTLKIEGGTLIFRKGKEDELPDRPPVVDNGANDWLYVKKTKTLNTDLANSDPTVLSADVNDVCLDPADEIHYEENENIFRNHVGAEDEFDYLKIRLEKGALLSFSLFSTDATKFIIYSLTPGKVTKGVQTYTQKALQTTTLKKGKETGIYYTADTNGILLEAGDYYIAMQSTAKKNGNAYYSVEVNQDASTFYVLGDNSDDWTDMKTAGDTSELIGDVGTITSDSAEGILAEWVGFGDAIDYKAFTLETDAIISLSINATDKTKFTIWKLNAKTSKNGVTTYSLTSLQATTLTKPKDAPWYSATTKSIILDKGTYYFSMESTNAKKGGSADYLVNLNSTGSFFFTHAQESFDDNWLYDKKTKSLNQNIIDFYVTDIHNTNTKTILLDGDEDIYVQVGSVLYRNFVGYGDTTDYAKIQLFTDAKLSFTVTSTGKGKFTIWRVDEKTDKKGQVTYSVKSLQATTLTASKKSSGFTCTTKSLALAEGEYYVSFQSTDAAKGGISYYNVELNLAGCSGIPSGEEVAEAMLYPGPDAVSEQSALTFAGDEAGALTSAVSALSDADANDAFLKESALLA